MAARWSHPFDVPIQPPRGKPLITLKDAAHYITKLPKAEHDAPEWQAATESDRFRYGASSACSDFAKLRPGRFGHVFGNLANSLGTKPLSSSDDTVPKQWAGTLLGAERLQYAQTK